jgi:hypothetical protein
MTAEGQAYDRAVAVIAAAPTRRSLESALDRLDISADAKAILRDMAGLTVQVGQQVLAVGRRVVAFALALLKAFPNPLLGVIVALVVTSLLASVPLLVAVLGALLGPLLLAFGLTMGAVNDMRSGRLCQAVDEFVDSLRGLAA